MRFTFVAFANQNDHENISPIQESVKYFSVNYGKIAKINRWKKRLVYNISNSTTGSRTTSSSTIEILYDTICMANTKPMYNTSKYRRLLGP